MNPPDGLHLEHLENSIETEPTYYMQHQQSLAKVLSPGRYQHGTSRNNLFDYTYAAGDMIVCNRGIDEFVRWESSMQFLKVDLPDHAFLAIAHETGADSIEIHSSTNLHDKRVDALVSAIQAEEESGNLSGRLYMDSIAQALASTLVQLPATSNALSRNTTAASPQPNSPESNTWSTPASTPTSPSTTWQPQQASAPATSTRCFANPPASPLISSSSTHALSTPKISSSPPNSACSTSPLAVASKPRSISPESSAPSPP
jgi:hypothetical protein